ncbi:hypothetical protein C6P46_006234 [Rhodotorula mucilaginosa]|uniref:Chromatin associated protein KTI12 n=1 Tax=Rhodotorula mucilaginosa TaxID=5537 RepID=A0A9P7B4H7_RHOMI|nr:hypothetical protein C6P46_006234 [Rhodotorula mucilaginosa]TKA55745.1 hypothetical protein B0A53_02881 [Rhodotorula sp. CCFEE 5036]
MAMVTMCGYPCSGKSTRAQQLAAFFDRKLADPSTPTHLQRALRRVVVVNDEGLSISKHAYDDARAEKPARAALFSAVQRSLAKEAIVIVDAMNYIKGSRYQMYCEAREVGVRTCTVFVATPPDQCRERNAARPDSTAYAPATLDNLISRFEEPQSAARWDAPLFTIATDDPPFDTPSPATTTQTGGGDDTVPLGSTEAERIWTAITEGVIKPSTVATQQATTSSTSYLTRLDSSSSALISSLLSLQSISPLSGPTTLSVPLSSSQSSSTTTTTRKNAESTTIRVTVDLNRPVTLPMLQRLKRQFIQLNARTASATEFGEKEIVSLFAQYVGEQTR